MLNGREEVAPRARKFYQPLRGTAFLSPLPPSVSLSSLSPSLSPFLPSPPVSLHLLNIFKEFLKHQSII